VVLIGWSLLGCDVWCQLIGLAVCGCICELWLRAAVDLCGQLLDFFSGGRPDNINKVALLGELIPDFDVVTFIGLKLQCLCGLRLTCLFDFVIVASLELLSWNSGLTQLEMLLTFGLGLQFISFLWHTAYHKPLNVAVFFGLLLARGDSQLSDRSFSIVVGAALDWISEGAINRNLFLWWTPLFVILTLLCPSIKKIYPFILTDIPAAYNECSKDDVSSLSRDINDILDQEDLPEWSPESESPLAPTPRPPPSPNPPSQPSTTIMSSTKRFLRLLLPLLTIGSANLSQATTHHMPSSMPPSSATSQQVKASFQFIPERLPWRERRYYQRVASQIEDKLALPLLGLFGRPVASAKPKPPTNDDSLIAEFVSDMNPAVEGMKWMLSANMDKVVMQRKPLQSTRMKPAHESVSVDLKRCRKTLNPPEMIGLLGAVESVFNSLSESAAPPLIVDSGASCCCCISPNRSDFVSYSSSKVRIKDLSGVNKVAGEGMLEWKILDRFGREQTISIKGYHVPKASVRLLSPQCVFQTFKGCKGGQDDEKYCIALPDGTSLSAPYGKANLPILSMSQPDDPKCLWSRCFSFDDTDPDFWARSLLDVKNMNLSNAQKELLRWHQKLSHAGLSTIHNLCRQKRTTKAKTVFELEAIRDGPMLPCTFNVPAATCDGLLCAACVVSKATRRAPSISSSTKPPPRSMVLKEGDLQPGDCVSCDHYMSPVPSRVIAESGYSSTCHGYTCGTIYVDHASGFMFVRNQKSISAEDTIWGKLLFEQEAAEASVKIQRYHSDNGVFSSKQFKSHCREMSQKLTFSGIEMCIMNINHESQVSEWNS
jgi:hypothetical protein